MKRPKIIKIVKPEDKSWYGGLYVVTFEQQGGKGKGNTWNAHMYKDQLDVIQMEDKMIASGVPEKMVSEFRELVEEHRLQEELRDGESW